MTIYNKLVRDRTLVLIEKVNGACTYSTLTKEEYPQELKLKLQADVQNVTEASNTEELADILEAVFALAKTLGVTEEELIASRNQKRQELGGFERGLFLQELID